MMTGDETTVLVAADGPSVIDDLRSWLSENYQVYATTDGDDALETFEDTDAALIDSELRTGDGAVVATELDQRSGPQQVAVLHSSDRPTACRGHPVDSLVEPLTRTAVLETVDRLLRRARYDELMSECATLAAKRTELEANGTPSRAMERELETLRRRLEELLSELDSLLATFDGADFRAAFETCQYGDSGSPPRASDLP